MCGLHAHDKRKQKSTGAIDFYGGCRLTEDSNVVPRIYVCVAINFIKN